MENETSLDFHSIEEQKQLIRKNIAKGICFKPQEIVIHSHDQLKAFVLNWYENLYHLKFLSHEKLEEQIFHGPQHVQKKCHNFINYDSVDLTQEDFQLALDILCLKKGINWNIADPFVSFDLQLEEKTYRVSLLHHDLCKEHGSKLFLRQHQQKFYDLELFHSHPDFLKKAIEEKKNILISGPTGSGKTSFLNTILQYAHKDEHLIILEDTYEIVCQHQNSTRLLARAEYDDDLKNFMAHAMRMSPDRIILGELRSREVEPFLLAMNSGHQGLISTIHANNGEDAINRVALLMQLYGHRELGFELVIKLVTQNIDYIVHMENKKVMEVCEVFGSEGKHIFYEKIYTHPSNQQEYA